MKVYKKFLALVLLIIILLIICIFVDDYKEHTVYHKWDNAFELVKTIPHEKQRFTEGLFIDNGTLVESSGGKDNKVYLRTDTNTGKAKDTINIKGFAEGCAKMNGALYVLTWKDGKAYRIHDGKTDTLDYSHEGWGLTTDGKNLIASDGTSKIYFLGEDLNEFRTINVTFRKRPIAKLNELEYVDGYIYANIWQTNKIVKINAKNGKIVEVYDFSSIHKDEDASNQDDVMNGIAYDSKKKLFYITGKNWSKMYILKQR